MCRRTRVIALLGVAAGWAPGCGGNIGRYATSVTFDAGGTPDAPMKENPLPFACQAPDAGEVPPDPAGCMTPATACVVDTAMQAGSCLYTRLRASVVPILEDCGVACGAVSIGFRGGCMTAVFLDGDVIDSPTGPSASVLCLRMRLLGTSWSCAPPDGWTRIFVAGCLTP
jgi:hypothetical protein